MRYSHLHFYLRKICVLCPMSQNQRNLLYCCHLSIMNIKLVKMKILSQVLFLTIIKQKMELIPCYNAFVIWISRNKDWQNNTSIRYRRKMYLQELGLALAKDNIERRAIQMEQDEGEIRSL